MISSPKIKNVHNDSLNIKFLEAVKNGRQVELQKLLEMGAEIEHTDELGRTAIMLAALNGHVETVEYLLHMGADINHTSRFGYTALMQAASNGHVATAEYLLNMGADIDYETERSNNAFNCAIEGHQTQVVKLLLEKGAARTKANEISIELNGAVCDDEMPVEIINLLLKYGGDPCYVHDDGCTLVCALELANADVRNAILDKVTDINKVDQKGWSYLHYAASQGRPKAVQFLLKNGADIELSTTAGETALYLVVDEYALDFFRNGYKITLDILLANGANIEHITDGGDTALMRAKRNNLTTVTVIFERVKNFNIIIDRIYSVYIERLPVLQQLSISEEGLKLSKQDFFKKLYGKMDAIIACCLPSKSTAFIIAAVEKMVRNQNEPISTCFFDDIIEQSLALSSDNITSNTNSSSDSSLASSSGSSTIRQHSHCSDDTLLSDSSSKHTASKRHKLVHSHTEEQARLPDEPSRCTGFFRFMFPNSTSTSVNASSNKKHKRGMR